MSVRIQEKKNHKLQQLLEAGYRLLSTRDIHDISISDITTQAGIAKGTFYLFFKDKYELGDWVIARESMRILRNAQQALDANDFRSFQDAIIFMINHILTQLEDNPILLRLIRRNLSFGVFHKHLQNAKIDDERDLCEAFITLASQCGYHYEDPRLVFFMVLELTGSLCYSALTQQIPASIEQVKPALFEAVRAILSSARQLPESSMTA